MTHCDTLPADPHPDEEEAPMDTPLEPNIIFRRIDKPRCRGWKRGEHYLWKLTSRFTPHPLHSRS